MFRLLENGSCYEQATVIDGAANASRQSPNEGDIQLLLENQKVQVVSSECWGSLWQLFIFLAIGNLAGSVIIRAYDQVVLGQVGFKKRSRNVQFSDQSSLGQRVLFKIPVR
jgi:hypothetical protein